MKLLWLVIFFLVFIWSGYEPKDRMIWILEVFPAIIGFLVLAFTYRNFQLTSITYILILAHMVVLMIGGHYTYAQVPLFDVLNDYFNSNRNNYDKVGHFMQGFVPVIIAREIVIRKNVFTAQNSWMIFFLLCFVLAVSAFYELLEWWSAILIGSSADEFLATQGYVWDTQSDMWYALLGGITSLAIFSRLHDKKLKGIL
jgi:putative membrane protein